MGIFHIKTNTITHSSDHTIFNTVNTTIPDAMSTVVFNRTVTETKSASTPTNIDPTELFAERSLSFFRRSTSLSNVTVTVFVRHPHKSIFSDLQLFLIRKLATSLIAVELSLDEYASEQMPQVATKHRIAQIVYH